MNAEMRVGWRVGEGWAGKVSAISAILGPYNAEVFGVSEAEPLPDELLTVVQCLLMPADDLKNLLGGGDDGGGDDDGGGGGGCDGDGTSPRMPLEQDQSFARLVGVALTTAVDAALARYSRPQEAEPPEEGPGEGEEGSARRARRRAAAATIVEGEMRALRATRRAASELMGAGGEAAPAGGGARPPSRSGSDDDGASDGDEAADGMGAARKRRRRAPPPRILFADSPLPNNQ